MIPGNIIIRQRGTKWHPGENVGMGKDHTIFATSEGKVAFRKTSGGRIRVGQPDGLKARCDPRPILGGLDLCQTEICRGSVLPDGAFTCSQSGRPMPDHEISRYGKSIRPGGMACRLRQLPARSP